jgi:hypothetical protein
MVNEYCTPGMVAAELRLEEEFGFDTFPSDDDVERWIQEESRIVDIRTGQVFSSTVVSSSLLDYDGGDVFRFPHSPLISLTSLEYNKNHISVEPEWLLLEGGFGKNYLLYEDVGEVEFINGNNALNIVVPREGKKRFRASYVYGYAVVPLEIQRLTTLLVAKRVIMSLASSQSNTEGGSIQVGTIRVSDPSNFSVNYLKSLNQEVSDLFGSIGQGLKVFRFDRVYD